jgi:hypothetical protein
VATTKKENMNAISVNYLDDTKLFQIVPMELKRDWMKDTQDSYAYRCTPMNVANQYGWYVLCPEDFSATWLGDEGTEGVSIRYKDNQNLDFAKSEFGHGVLTISVDFVLRTEPNISTYIRGVPNFIKDGIQPLDAIVETDWLPFTFTYNFKFTRHARVEFKKGEPLFSFFPIIRDFAEGSEIYTTTIDSDPVFLKQYLEYSGSRDHYLKHNDGSFQKFYKDAKDPSGNSYNPTNHKPKISFKKPNNNV